MRFLGRNVLSRLKAVSRTSEIQRPRWIGGSSCLCQDTTTAGGGVQSPENSEGLLRDAYHCSQAWNKRLETPILQKINIDDFFYDIDKRYQMDKVISAIDVDLFANKVTEPQNLEEMEDLVHKLRRSPATADSLPSTSHAVIRALLDAGQIDDLMRILNDRWNFGVFVDHHMANILMDQFLKSGNSRDAAKVASLLMLEEDFGSPTSRYFALLSCLRYLQNPSPEQWGETPPKEESEEEEEIKVRLYWIRNPYYDEHFDLTNPSHIVGKTLAMVAGEVEDEVLSRSAQLLGNALFEKWNKVEMALKEFIDAKKPVAEEALLKVSELCEKALAEMDASADKTLTKPKVHQYPGVNLEEKKLSIMWKQIGYPENEKIIPKVKALLTQAFVKTDLNMANKARELVSAALAEHEDVEIKKLHQVYQEWHERRLLELDSQMKRFRKFEVLEDVEAKKKQLKEKEDMIFFFDNEEEWMMKLPPDEQQGYKLPTDYIPTNWTPFVKTIPPKKIRTKKKKE